MFAKKVALTLLGLTASGLIACNTQSDYEKYSSCLLNTMKGQDVSMKHHAEESCELKHPYERSIYWKNDIDINFSTDPIQKTVLFKVNENKSNYRITKIEVTGNYRTCANIPEEPKKPQFQSAYSYEDRAKMELGFTAQKTTSDRFEAYIEQRKLINERASVIKSVEDQEKTLAYQADLDEYNIAQSSWSSPLELKLNRDRGEVEIYMFEQSASATTFDLRMWQKGPQCIRYIKVQGLRYR